jgi:acylphosphatase
MHQVRLRISGAVQGVGFRYFAKAEADRLGISGWIRNCADGTVETVGCGLPEAVEAYVQWCHEGPRSARVESVEPLAEPEKCSFSSFEILPNS